MRALVPIDIEAALVEALAPHLAVKVLAPPLPQKLPAESVCVTRTGGSRRDMVLDQSMVSVDCRAERIARAMELAGEAAGVICELGYDGTFPATGINALPYYNPDPTHPDVARVSFTAVVSARANSKEIRNA